MLQRFLPTGPNKSSMQYQIFRNKNSTDEQFHLIADMYARVVSEDKILCELAQKNLNAGIFVNGELHPRLEKGPLYFQKVAREVIWEHAKREQAAKKEWWFRQRSKGLQTQVLLDTEQADLEEVADRMQTQEGRRWLVDRLRKAVPLEQRRPA